MKSVELNFDTLLLSNVKKLVTKVKCETKSLLINQGYNLSHEEVYIYILIVFKNINTVSSLSEVVVNSHKSNVSRIIKQLINKELIGQVVDLSDKRVKHFIINNEKFAKDLKKIIININDKYKNKISIEEYNTFLEILNKMVE